MRKRIGEKTISRTRTGKRRKVDSRFSDIFYICATNFLELWARSSVRLLGKGGPKPTVEKRSAFLAASLRKAGVAWIERQPSSVPGLEFPVSFAEPETENRKQRKAVGRGFKSLRARFCLRFPVSGLGFRLRQKREQSDRRSQRARQTFLSLVSRSGFCVPGFESCNSTSCKSEFPVPSLESRERKVEKSQASSSARVFLNSMNSTPIAPNPRSSTT